MATESSAVPLLEIYCDGTTHVFRPEEAPPLFLASTWCSGEAAAREQADRATRTLDKVEVSMVDMGKSLRHAPNSPRLPSAAFIYSLPSSSQLSPHSSFAAGQVKSPREEGGS